MINHQFTGVRHYQVGFLSPLTPGGQSLVLKLRCSQGGAADSHGLGGGGGAKPYKQPMTMVNVTMIPYQVGYNP